MADTLFEDFYRAFPPAQDRIPFDVARHGDFAKQVPPDLADQWRKHGFGAYGSGLIWACDPSEPFVDPEDWQGIDKSAIEIFRTAFADVCFWQKNQFVFLSVHSGKLSRFGSNAEILYATFLPPDFRKSVLLERIFKIARKRLGELKSDECFGFAPLPALGGAISEEYLIKSKLREYIAMAAQVLDSD